MALGAALTAKGKRIDFAELARRSKKPVSSVVADMKDKVTRQVPPAPILQARGNMPTHDGVKRPEYDAPAPVAALTARTYNRPLEMKTMADYTSITIDEPKHMREPPADSAQSANEALKEILGGDMNRMKSNQPGRTRK